MLPTPGFHHIHLRATDPDAMIGFYCRQFPTSRPGTWAGLPALFCPNDVMILFDGVASAAPSHPPSAIWHFGWHVRDVRETAAAFSATPEVRIAPLYTGVEDNWVTVSSDTWFRTGDLLGVSREQIAANRAAGTPPPGGPGFAYFRAPDGALFEIAGDFPAERFNHVHMWQEDPAGAQLWYQEHLNAPHRASFGAAAPSPRDDTRTFPALAREGMARGRPGGVTFGDVDVIWYGNQGSQPLAPSIGQYQDHLALSVGDLDAWMTKLRGEGVRVLAEPYRLGETRAAMIAGPSGEGLELVETA